MAEYAGRLRRSREGQIMLGALGASRRSTARRCATSADASSGVRWSAGSRRSCRSGKSRRISSPRKALRRASHPVGRLLFSEHRRDARRVVKLSAFIRRRKNRNKSRARFPLLQQTSGVFFVAQTDERSVLRLDTNPWFTGRTSSAMHAVHLDGKPHRQRGNLRRFSPDNPGRTPRRRAC